MGRSHPENRRCERFERPRTGSEGLQLHACIQLRSALQSLAKLSRTEEKPSTDVQRANSQDDLCCGTMSYHELAQKQRAKQQTRHLPSSEIMHMLYLRHPRNSGDGSGPCWHDSHTANDAMRLRAHAFPVLSVVATSVSQKRARAHTHTHTPTHTHTHTHRGREQAKTWTQKTVLRIITYASYRDSAAPHLCQASRSEAEPLPSPIKMYSCLAVPFAKSRPPSRGKQRFANGTGSRAVPQAASYWISLELCCVVSSSASE